MSRNLPSLLLAMLSLLLCRVVYSQGFVSPGGNLEALSVDKDPAKYYMIRPGSELIFKISGPTTMKIYGRILNPAKAGNASLMVNQGNVLIGAMLITPKASTDLLQQGKVSLSQVSVQEFNVSEGAQQIKIRSSAKSPDVIIAVEVASKKAAEQSIDLIPLVPLAPLVPPKKEERPHEGIDLVPFTPSDTKTAKKGEGVQIAGSKGKREGQYREISAKPADITAKRSTPTVTTVVETPTKLEIDKRHFSASPDIGIIVPFQSIGGPYLNIDLLFNLYPVKPNRAFGIGMRTGFHNLNIDVKDGGGNSLYTMDANIIPISIILSYSVPLSFRLISDLSAGGGISVVSADLNGRGSNPSRSESTVTFLFEVGGALMYKIDRNNSIGGRVGFVGGRASTDFVSDLDIGGLILSTVYSFTF